MEDLPPETVELDEIEDDQEKETENVTVLMNTESDDLFATYGEDHPPPAPHVPDKNDHFIIAMLKRIWYFSLPIVAFEKVESPKSNDGDWRKKFINFFISFRIVKHFRELFLSRQNFKGKSLAMLITLKANLKAGVTTALVSMPLSLGIASSLPGVSGSVGVTSAFWSTLISFLFSGCRYSIMSPTSITAGVLAKNAGEDMYGGTSLSSLEPSNSCPLDLLLEWFGKEKMSSREEER
eukprot:TRINITY_DN5098_c0_g1_i2.p1 TRINITY_DN5098_c0_g1~~TRINITY_DN5098_c0_g1_i2.p1  ORF type:complete len:237 (+),score=59.41 TRINITY_DN5098_c0_g1_i2:60-770(+)